MAKNRLGERRTLLAPIAVTVAGEGGLIFGDRVEEEEAGRRHAVCVWLWSWPKLETLDRHWRDSSKYESNSKGGGRTEV